MLNGVSFADPSSVTVEPEVQIEKDTFIARGVVLRGRTQKSIEDATVDAHSVLDDTVVQAGAVVHSHSSVKERSLARDLP